jgi:hypothetical protein
LVKPATRVSGVVAAVIARARGGRRAGFAMENMQLRACAVIAATCERAGDGQPMQGGRSARAML